MGDACACPCCLVPCSDRAQVAPGFVVSARHGAGIVGPGLSTVDAGTRCVVVVHPRRSEV